MLGPVLVTGASGTVGARLVAGLLDRGHSVRALVLPGDPFARRLDGLRCERVEGDITKPATLDRALAGIDTVYHLAAIILSEDPAVLGAINVGGTRAMLDAATHAGARHFIYVSSISVTYPRSTPYSRSKRECERLVRERSKLAHTIVRPTLVYEQNGAEEWMRYWNQLRRWRRLPFVPMVGAGAARKSPVHVDDLMSGLIALAGNSSAFGKTYDLCGGESITMRELTELLLERDGVAKPLVPIPVPLCRLGAKLMRRMMDRPPITISAIEGVTQDAVASPASAAADLGYRPRGVREGFRALSA